MVHEAGAKGQGRVRRLLPGLVVAIVLVVAAVVALTRGGGDDAAVEEAAAGPVRGPVTGIERRIDGDPFALGRVDAPVVLVQYADYRCPFCSKFTVDTQPELIQRYVNSGILRMEWRDFPIFGKESEAAARAGQAAARQGRFAEFHKLVAEAAPGKGHIPLPNTRLVEFARKAGVSDIARFRRDMQSDAARRAVEVDRDEGLALGVSSTPAFVINGFPLLGAQPVEEFAAVIERARGR